MDWAEAIERNAAALLRILAGLLASAGYADGTVAARLPGPIYRAALRVLRPMESAVRRLIVIAARDVVVKPVPVRPWVKGRAIVRKAGGGGRISFKLFDTRKRFDFAPRRKSSAKGKGPGPRVWTLDPYDAGILCPLFRPRPAASPVPIPVPDGTVSALRLGRRLVAVKMALEDIPRQALRMARLITRRERIKLARPTTLTSPLRIGRPPGHRKKPKDEVDFVLNECHWLARDELRADTS